MTGPADEDDFPEFSRLFQIHRLMQQDQEDDDFFQPSSPFKGTDLEISPRHNFSPPGSPTLRLHTSPLLPEESPIHPSARKAAWMSPISKRVRADDEHLTDTGLMRTVQKDDELWGSRGVSVATVRFDEEDDFLLGTAQQIGLNEASPDPISDSPTHHQRAPPPPSPAPISTPSGKLPLIRNSWSDSRCLVRPTHLSRSFSGPLRGASSLPVGVLTTEFSKIRCASCSAGNQCLSCLAVCKVVIGVMRNVESEIGNSDDIDNPCDTKCLRFLIETRKKTALRNFQVVLDAVLACAYPLFKLREVFEKNAYRLGLVSNDTLWNAVLTFVHRCLPGSLLTRREIPGAQLACKMLLYFVAGRDSNDEETDKVTEMMTGLKLREWVGGLTGGRLLDIPDSLSGAGSGRISELLAILATIPSFNLAERNLEISPRLSEAPLHIRLPRFSCEAWELVDPLVLSDIESVIEWPIRIVPATSNSPIRLSNKRLSYSLDSPIQPQVGNFSSVPAIVSRGPSHAASPSMSWSEGTKRRRVETPEQNRIRGMKALLPGRSFVPRSPLKRLSVVQEELETGWPDAGTRVTRFFDLRPKPDWSMSWLAERMVSAIGEVELKQVVLHAIAFPLENSSSFAVSGVSRSMADLVGRKRSQTSLLNESVGMNSTVQPHLVKLSSVEEECISRFESEISARLLLVQGNKAPQLGALVKLVSAEVLVARLRGSSTDTSPTSIHPWPFDLTDSNVASGIVCITSTLISDKPGNFSADLIAKLDIDWLILWAVADSVIEPVIERLATCLRGLSASPPRPQQDLQELRRLLVTHKVWSSESGLWPRIWTLGRQFKRMKILKDDSVTISDNLLEAFLTVATSLVSFKMVDVGMRFTEKEQAVEEAHGFTSIAASSSSGLLERHDDLHVDLLANDWLHLSFDLFRAALLFRPEALFKDVHIMEVSLCCMHAASLKCGRPLTLDELVATYKLSQGVELGFAVGMPERMRVIGGSEAVQSIAEWYEETFRGFADGLLREIGAEVSL